MTEREGSSYHDAGLAVIEYLGSISILPGNRDVGRIEIGLAGPLTQSLHVGGFTPGRETAETYIDAMNACLRGAEGDAVQYTAARQLKHEKVGAGQNLIYEVLSSPYARDMVFDVSDHWHLVEVVATTLMKNGSLSQAEGHQIVQATER